MEDNISIEDLNSVQKRISILISPETVDRKFSEFFANFKDVDFKGFRKGKVPLKVLKQRLGSKANPEVLKQINEEYFKKAVSENNINPISANYEENTGEINKDGSYFVKFLVDVLPVVRVSDYDNMTLITPQINKNKIATDKMLNYQKQFAERKQITDRKVQLGDTVVLDFVGFIDGQQFQGGSATGYTLENVGQDNFIVGFGQQVIGTQINEEKPITVKFPELYPVSALANKDVVFKVKLHSIIETKPAEINEDLAMMVGFSSVAELQEAVQKETEQQVEKMIRIQLEGQVISQLMEKNPTEVPKSLIQLEKQRLMGNQKPMPQVLQMIETTAKHNVHKALLLDLVYEQESGIEITPDELDNLLETFSKEQQITKDELVSNLYNSKQMDAFMGVLRAKKALDLIISKATIKEQENG